MRGELPEARKQALIESMSVRIGPTDVLAKHVAAEEAISGTPLVAGNKAILLDDGPATMRAIGSTPDKSDHAVYKTYISAFSHADNTIHLTTAYFVPDRQTMQAMIDAARRGVDVKVIFPSFTDVGLLLHAGRSFYEELLDAGIKVYERKDALLHAKTAVIDGVWSTIGSTNIDMRSFLHNDEINAVVLNVDFAQRMEELFERDLQESVEITHDAWRKRGFIDRFKEWAARVLEYWL